jgi:hypothetical protein
MGNNRCIEIFINLVHSDGGLGLAFPSFVYMEENDLNHDPKQAQQLLIN